MKRIAFPAALLLGLLCGATESRAHEVRPAYLEVRRTAADTYDVLWKVPAAGDDLRLGIYVRFPDDVEILGEPRALFADGGYLERSRVRLPGGLAGRTIRFDGLEATPIDVLARIDLGGGVVQTLRILPDRPELTIEAAPGAWRVSRTYLALGVEHILLGVDHLLFVLALILLVDGWKRLVGTISAFTAAHSLTLAAATLGFVHVPGPPVEAAIALSIVFVAAEIVHGREGRPGLTARAPWIVAFTFGLLHGLGFAGALSQVGLPQQAIPLALLFFNLGVELGQLAFVAVVLALLALGRRMPVRGPAWSWRIAPYAIGSLAMFWVIQRALAF
ncbi:MAG: HupE/UreJ family protein [Thermoanaerobaculia bacterium]